MKNIRTGFFNEQGGEMQTFDVGEIAIYVHKGSRHYGEEVVIIAPPQKMITYIVSEDPVISDTAEKIQFVYPIEGNHTPPADRTWCSTPEDLRKLPDANKKIEWSRESGWIPDSLVIHEREERK